MARTNPSPPRPLSLLETALLTGFVAFGAFALGFWWGASPAPVRAGDAVEDPRLEQRIDREVERVRRNPTALAHAQLGMLYEANRLWRHAAECYRNALRLDPEENRWLYRLAVVMDHGAADPGATLQVLALVQAREPDHVPALQRLGHAFLYAGDTWEALRHYSKVLKYEPNSVIAHAGIGEAYLQRGELESAATYLDRAVELDPGYRVARHARGRLHRRLGRLEKASIDLALGEGARPRIDPVEDELAMAELVGGLELYRNRIRQSLRAGLLREAVAAAGKARADYPEDLFLAEAEAIALMESGDLSGARAIIERLAREHPHLESAPFTLAECLRRGGQLEGALAALDEVANRFAHLAKLHSRRAALLHELGRHGEARAAYERAATADAGDAEPRLALAKSAGDAAARRRWLLAAAEADPASASARRALARDALAAKDASLAARSIAALRQIAPSDAALPELQAALEEVDR